jgi:hypothetical protein
VWDQQRKKTLGVRIMLGVVVGLLGAGMLLYLLPGLGTKIESSAFVVAQVYDHVL